MEKITKKNVNEWEKKKTVILILQKIYKINYLSLKIYK